MAKGSGNTRSTAKTSNSAVASENANTFKSSFGFGNVVKEFQYKSVISSSVPVVANSIEPNTSNVQEYLDTGKFDAYSNNSGVKKGIYEEIARDMKGRGFNVYYDKDLKRLTSSEGKQIIISKNRAGKWLAKDGNASANSKDGSFREAINESIKRKQRKEK